MKKKVAVALLLVLVAFLLAAAPAATVVYVTRTGEKYHLDGCRSLAKSRIPTTLGEAVARGYGPCGICHPPTLDAKK